MLENWIKMDKYIRPIAFWIICLFLMVRKTYSLDLASCNMALGMETHEILDKALTSSSQVGGVQSTVAAKNGRIRDPSAWCPEGKVGKTSHEYLQINFDEMKVITLVETQGRFGNGMGQEYADQYKLEYQREASGQWFTFKNRRGRELFTGNMNTYSSEIREIDPPIITKRVRFVPYSETPRNVCMRVEVFGCTWLDSVVSYAMPQGEARGAEIDLQDFTYDGKKHGGFLSGGLGQLTDGEQGTSNFRTLNVDVNIKGYEWIGWRNDSFVDKPVELVFKFESVRNFTSMRIFINNYFSRDVRVFKKAMVYTSIGGEYFTDEAIHFNYMRDSIMEYARPVIISLNHKVGQFVKVQLFFDAKWLLISEVEFESRAAAGVFPLELPPATAQPPSTSSTTTSKGGSIPPLVDGDKPAVVLPDDKGNSNGNNNDGKTNGEGGNNSGNGGGDVDNNKKGDNNQDSEIDEGENGIDPAEGNVEIGDKDKTATLPSTTSNIVVPAPRENGIREEHIGIIVGTIIAFLVILAVIIIFIVLKNRKRKHRHRAYLPAENSTFGDLRTGTLKSSKSSNGNLYNFVATSDIDSDRGITCCANNANTSTAYGDISDGSVHKRNFPDFPKTPDSTLSNSRDYAVPDIMQSAVLPNGTTFVYNPNQLGTISGSICAAPLPNLPHGTYHNNNLVGGGQPPRLPVPPPPPTNPPVAAPYASSDLVTLQAPRNIATRSVAPVNSSFQCPPIRSSTPVTVSNPPMGSNTAPPPTSSNQYNSINNFLQSLPRTGTMPKMANIQGMVGNNVYSPPTVDHDDMWAEELAVMEFPRLSLKFLEKIGEGQFGEVHLCLAQNLDDLIGGDFLVNRTGSAQDLLVAVKMLRHNADNQARENFKQEAKIMSRLKDPNIVQVLGVCSSGDPLCVIVEYMKFGDLHEFLQKHALEGTKTVRKNVKTLSYGCLIYMATQIASGMKYLETQNLVHRDLAARNCLVGNYYTIKISDFGMSRGLYSCDYYKIEGRAMLPIRWMAWESVILGKFSSKSDVWSFAVTLWEVLNFARDQPFGDCSDEIVIENCTHFYHNDGKQMNLPLPKYCAKEIYDLMCECWHQDENQRPSFREINMFLHRKSMGYNPRDECPGDMSIEHEQDDSPPRYDIV